MSAAPLGLSMNPSSTDFDYALITDLESSAAWYRQGNTLSNLGRYAEALASFNQAIAIQPESHDSWVFRGVVLIYLERYEEALESCDRAIEIFPGNTEAWTFRGVALHRLGRYKEAYASYNWATGEKQEPFGLRLMRRLQRTWKAVFLSLHV